MKFLIQRVREASVTVDEKCIGKIRSGFLVFIGIDQTDSEQIADKMIKKLLNLRIFEDENGKTNLSLDKVDGSLLLISQFTLYADCRHGNRPSFTDAGAPDRAKELYEYIAAQCRDMIGADKTATGEFGADMKVSLINDGPFTIMLDSKELF